jgi:hypothetical protein
MSCVTLVCIIRFQMLEHSPVMVALLHHVLSFVPAQLFFAVSTRLFISPQTPGTSLCDSEVPGDGVLTNAHIPWKSNIRTRIPQSSQSQTTDTVDLIRSPVNCDIQTGLGRGPDDPSQVDSTRVVCPLSFGPGKSDDRINQSPLCIGEIIGKGRLGSVKMDRIRSEKRT